MCNSVAMLILGVAFLARGKGKSQNGSTSLRSMIPPLSQQSTVFKKQQNKTKSGQAFACRNTHPLQSFKHEFLKLVSGEYFLLSYCVRSPDFVFF